MIEYFNNFEKIAFINKILSRISPNIDLELTKHKTLVYSFTIKEYFVLLEILLPNGNILNLKNASEEEIYTVSLWKDEEFIITEEYDFLECIETLANYERIFYD